MSAALAKYRVQWCVEHDRAAVPAGWWAKLVDPYVRCMAMQMMAGLPSWKWLLSLHSMRWKKPHYRWKARR